MAKIEYIPKFTVSGKSMRLIMEIAAAMVEAFARGAKEAGHAVETVCVGTMQINGCSTCGGIIRQ